MAPSTLPAPVTSTAAPSSSSTAVHPSTSTSTTSGSATSVTSTSPATTSVPACAADGLTVAVSAPTDPGAGSVSYVLTFVDKGASPCSLKGYPGVSFQGATGVQFGAAATRTGRPVSPVTLGPGQAASAVVRVANAANFDPATCQALTADGFSVIPPGATASVHVSAPQQACTSPADPQLQINPIVAGVASG